MPKEQETVVTVVSHEVEDTTPGGGEACLVVFYGKNLGKRYFIDKPEQSIGRSDSASIQADQESVSRQHVKIYAKDGRIHAADLGSTNGTFVNNERINDIELRDGDLLRVGQTIFKYLSGSNIENKYHEEIYRLTTIDGLTQAYNKRYFLETAARELNRSSRYGRGLSLVLFDIDHFKKINDSHGHLAGDYVLRELATLVAKSIRREDVFARYGGEEFALILPEVDGQGAFLVCEKLRVLVEYFPFEFAHKKIPVTISMGIRSVAAGEDVSNPDAFIAEADAKLYEAKQNGRNKTCV